MNKKMLVVFDGLNYGGIERVGINYLKLLDKMDYDVTVLNLIKKKNDLENEIPKRFKIVRKNYYRRSVIYTYDDKFKNKLFWKIIRPVINLILLLKKKSIKLKENEFEIAIAFSGHYNDLEIIKTKVNAKYRIAWLHGSLYDYYLIGENYFKYYELFKNVVVLSDLNKDKVNSNLFNVQKIYNPLDILNKPIDINKVESLVKKYGNYMLMVARFSKQKDHITIIKAYKYLKENYGFNENLLFVGEGNTLSNVMSYVKDLHLEESIHFLGAKSDVENYYYHAKMFVHASPAEGLPTVLIEAMSFKKPVVTTNSLPGVTEIIQNKYEGIVCPLNDYKCVGEAIYKLYNDENLYHLYSDGGFVRSNDFTFETIFKQLKSFLNDLK